MKEAISRAVYRMKNSAFTAGAMHRLFVCVGNEKYQTPLLKEMASVGFEVCAGEMSPLSLFPLEYIQHEGSHFNKKIFVLQKIDRLFGNMKDELFRRLEFERGKFVRTATWTLIWIESLETAEQLRNKSAGTWNLANDIYFFQDPPELATASVDSGPLAGPIQSSLGSLFVPSEISKKTIEEVMKDLSTPSLRFWSDLLRLSPQDAMLSFGLSLQESKSVPYSTLEAMKILGRELSLMEFSKTVAQLAGSLSIKPDSTSSWVDQGERAMIQADQLYAAGKGEAALTLLRQVLDGPQGFLTQRAFLLADRPLRLRVILLRAMGKISEASLDLDRWEEIVQASGLPSMIRALYEARAMHMEDLGDRAQAEKIREKMI